MYKVAICQLVNLDWQEVIIFQFKTLDETVSFVSMCLKQNNIQIHIKTLTDVE